MSLWRSLFGRGARRAGEGKDGDDDMLTVLAALGIPLQRSASDGKTALTGGAAKAAIYQAHRQIRFGNADDALATVESVLDTAEFGLHPSSAPIAAAGFYLRGQAHEAKGLTLPAQFDYETALKISPNHRPARDALARLVGGLPG